MMRMMLNCKIHRATVTEANLDYEGSITIDQNLMDSAGLLPYESVHIYNISNGERFDTYAISGQKDSGVICLNGAAARKVNIGDMVIIANYTILDDEEARTHEPTCIYVDHNNRILNRHSVS